LRLDVFLKRVGLCKQRTLAKGLCDAGKVKASGAAAKAGREVTPGATIEIEFRQDTLTIQVTGLPDRNYTRKDGEAFYSVIGRRDNDVFA
jgi:ribosomal 50S subunit-recycling heat shock protein